MKNTKILEKYVCLSPFTHLDVQNNGDYVCCPSWCPTNIGNEKRLDWVSENAQKIRESMLDGSYSHCDHSVCPNLNLLINMGTIPYGFMEKEEFLKKYNTEKYKDGPEDLLFGWDRSCNLRCPSCRSNFIHNEPEGSIEFKESYDLLKTLEENFGQSVKRLMITGSGDPFYSNIYRNYLKDFDKSKYPNLEKIQIITNGNLLTEKMWKSLKASPYIKQIEISIDAGTKETYENITRIGGRWERLIENLKFLSNLDSLEDMMVSMVVSQHNYKEMLVFYNLMCDIFKNSKYFLHINFRQHVFWGTGSYSMEDFNKISVFNENHELFNDFKMELLKVHGKPFINHNFNHLIEKRIV